MKSYVVMSFLGTAKIQANQIVELTRTDNGFVMSFLGTAKVQANQIVELTRTDNCFVMNCQVE
jgi:hypothetical protein